MTHTEAQELLGAYALDAVPEDESGAISAHVATCPICKEELRGYRTVTAALGPQGAAAPPDIWDRIANQLTGTAEAEQAPEPLRLVRPSAPPPRPAMAWALRTVAAAAVIAVAVLAWGVAHLDGRIGQLQRAVSQTGVAQAAGAAALEPGSRRVEMRATSGSGTANVVLTASGQAYVVASTLPDLQANKTYQLWGISGQKGSAPVSLALLGTRAAPAAFRVDPHVKTLAITAEPQGGSVAPTSRVLMEGTV